MTEYAWFDKGDGRQTYRRVSDDTPPQRSSLGFPMIISDTMDAVEHPCDGKHYSSKSTFRRVTREHGCIEVGNDPARKQPVKRKSDDKGIDVAIDKALARAS